MGFSDSQTKTKVGFFLSLCAFLFDIIGLSTPYWVAVYFDHQGLFVICPNNFCLSYTGADWQIASRALCIIGCILGVGCVCVIGLYVFVKNEMVSLKKLGCFLAFAATGFTIIGAGVFAGIYSETGPSDLLSWSFGLTVVGGILYIPVGLLMVN